MLELHQGAQDQAMAANCPARGCPVSHNAVANENVKSKTRSHVWTRITLSGSIGALVTSQPRDTDHALTMPMWDK